MRLETEKQFLSRWVVEALKHVKGNETVYSDVAKVLCWAEPQ